MSSSLRIPFFRESNQFITDSDSDSDSDDDSDDDDDDDSSNSSTLSLQTHSSHHTTTSTSTSDDDLPLPIPRPTQPHPHLKLSLSLLRTRHSLTLLSSSSPQSSYSSLSHSLKSLSFSPSQLQDSLLVPILYRLVLDLRNLLGREESREKRRGLRKDEARVAVGLRQRWCDGGGKGNGKGNGNGFDWVSYVSEKVSLSPPPFSFSPHNPLLTALESLLLPSSLPLISLSNLSLSSPDLQNWDLLRDAQNVLAWYFSFEPSDSDSDSKAKEVLRGVKVLDLSHNNLTTFPSFLPSLFPSLESLSLAHNDLSLLPSSITLWSQLRRLNTRDNPLGRGREGKLKSNGEMILRILEEREEEEGPMSLVEISIGILLSLPDDGERDLPHHLPHLPHHLQHLLIHSYTCASCQSLTTPLSPHFLPPLIERIHHLSPGISLPKSHAPPLPSSSSSPPPSASLHLLTLEERVLLALIARGGRKRKEGYLIEGRYCSRKRCAKAHLVGNCECAVCREERRAREGSVLRWWRIRVGAGRGMERDLGGGGRNVD